MPPPRPPPKIASDNVHLDVPYARKDEAKVLGARFDGAVKRWYVPKGLDLAPFTQWLPAGALTSAVSTGPAPLDLALGAAGALPVPASASDAVSLSRLLAGVGTVVARSFPAGVWTTAEISQVTIRGGHVYLELAEQDAGGTQIAKARGMIWANVAGTILSTFERATGAVLAAGMKVLVRARPAFAPRYGMSLEIDAIDPNYTLGDMEARKREIRERLGREGVFDANRSLPAPWDYRAVLVVAPAGAAGLGDFTAESLRLERAGVCTFKVIASRFQGAGAAAQIRQALEAALAGWLLPNPPDAVVIIRGGGPVNDLAWLNDYALARFVCDCPVPVLTGIGHQKDSTVLDEVAHRAFDTPSKVILGIEDLIRTRAGEARVFLETVAVCTRRIVARSRSDIAADGKQVLSDAHIVLELARAGADNAFIAVDRASVQAIAQVTGAVRDAIEDVRTVALGTTMRLRKGISLLQESVHGEARASLKQAAALTEREMQATLTTARLDARRARADVAARMGELGGLARRTVQQAGAGAEALLREVSGQGPERTLKRGFALVRGPKGKPLTRASDGVAGDRIEIVLGDGSLHARVEADTKGAGPAKPVK